MIAAVGEGLHADEGVGVVEEGLHFGWSDTARIPQGRGMGEERGDSWVVGLLLVVAMSSRLLEEADQVFHSKPS